MASSINAMFVSGNTGEMHVKSLLEQFGCRFYYNIYFKNNAGELCQVDFLVLLGNTLITIEVKTPTLAQDASKGIHYGVIRSARGNNVWLRSSAKLDNKIGTITYAVPFADAVRTYPQGSSYILNDGESGIAASAAGGDDLGS